MKLNKRQISALVTLIVIICLGFGIACAPPRTSKYSKPTIKVYSAIYEISLQKVERPEKASKRYGRQKVDILTSDEKYKYIFEDDMVKISWLVTGDRIIFRLLNKTDYSIKIPWDDAAYVDENGGSHRVMHSGVKYNDRDKQQPPSIIVRRKSIDDNIFPADYVTLTSGSWVEKPLFLNQATDYEYSTKRHFYNIADFEKAVKGNIGKELQVLLPLQIQDVINDYIFTFKVDNVKAEEKEGDHQAIVDFNKAIELDHKNSQALYGIIVHEITSEIVESMALPKMSGVVVMDVKKGSPAEKFGINQGDIISHVNKVKITSVEGYISEISKISAEDTVLLLIERGTSTYFVKLRND